jgi:hypothetical protein
MLFDCALDRGNCVCTLQWATAVGDIVSLHSLHCSAMGCSYQSRSSSCRSIARSGWRPYWATVDVRAVSMGVVGFAVVRQAKLEMSTSKRISTADVASVRTSAPSVSAVSKTPTGTTSNCYYLPLDTLSAICLIRFWSLRFKGMLQIFAPHCAVVACA